MRYKVTALENKDRYEVTFFIEFGEREAQKAERRTKTQKKLDDLAFAWGMADSDLRGEDRFSITRIEEAPITP